MKSPDANLVPLHDVAMGHEGRPDAALRTRRRAVRGPQSLQPLLLLHFQLERLQSRLCYLLDRRTRLEPNVAIVGQTRSVMTIHVLSGETDP